MANIGFHIASAIPFVVVGQYSVALGCVLPDAAWLPNELKIQRDGNAQRVINNLSARELWLYRITHSMLLWGIVWLLGVGSDIAIGALIHILFDLPTHRGRMRQQPLYPMQWRWPWAL